MFWISVGSSIFAVIGIAFLFDIHLSDIENIIFKLFNRKKSLLYKIKVSQNQKRENFIVKYIKSTYKILKTIKAENKFILLCLISLAIIITGIFISLGTNMIVFALAGLIIGVAFPYSYAKNKQIEYNKQLDVELETALSIVTTSYQSSEDIIYSIESNIEYIHSPVKEIFEEFLSQTKLINSNVKYALQIMREKIDNEIFHEWIDNLIDCQDDSGLKLTLVPLSTKLSDIRIVNAELDTILQNPKNEFYTLLIMSVGIIPLFYFINRDWFNVLTDTVYGNIALSIIAIVDIISLLRMLHITKPIRYRR